MALCEKILIIGFSGAGKSSLVNLLKLKLSSEWDHFDDLDALILKKYGRNENQLSELIEKSGWDKFRLWERQLLEEWLKKEGKGVLALGGGALSPVVWEIYKNSKKILFCHLFSSFEDCWERLLNSNEKRLLMLEGKKEFKEIYEKRMKLFEKIEFTITNHRDEEMDVLVNKFRQGYLSRIGGNKSIS